MKTKTKEVIGIDPARNAVDCVGVVDSSDAALMQAATQIGAALIARYGVAQVTPGEAERMAATALVYARAIVAKVRG